MFQTPTCMLMNLDSSVVQLNFFSPLLLVSTLARCYICDTVREQYKQIGNKARNGEFGACFYKAHMYESGASSDVQRETKNNTRSAFNLISDDSNVIDENHPKIFCARPGSRLWEVSADGIVVKTHQLKAALAVPPTTIFRSASSLISSHEEEDEEKKVERTKREWPLQSVNFSQLFTIAHKYLFSYSTSGLYIIDPANASIMLWNNEFANISMTAVANDKIYLMTCDNEFHCLELSLLDVLVLRLYCREDYRECLRACTVYRKHLSQTIATTAGRIVELENLSRVQPYDEETLALQLQPLIMLLRSNNNNKPAKLDSGIVVVHSENDKFAIGKKTYICGITSPSQSSETSNEGSSGKQISESTKNLTQSNISDTVSVKEADSNYNTEILNVKDDDCQQSDLEENVTHKVQSDLESIYATANSVKCDMSEKEVEKIISDMNKKMKTIAESYRDSPGLHSFVYEVMRAAELHYHNVFLENTTTQLLRFTNSEYIIQQFVRAFVDVNVATYVRCSCSYPYPMDKVAVEPRFLEVGEALIEKLANDLPEECGDICNRVPYMWRTYLVARIERRNSLDDVLRQCLQTRDNVVLSFLLPALNEQQWSCAITCLSEIKNGSCLFCAIPLVKKPDYDILIDWSGVAREIMDREGPDEAMAFLIKLQNMIPNVTLDRRY